MTDNQRARPTSPRDVSAQATRDRSRINSMMRRQAMNRDIAEMLAIDALTFIAADSDRLSRFLALSGIEAQSLRDAAREPNFLLGVLDHLVADDPLLREFALHKEIEPEMLVKARDLLAGAPPATP